MAKNPISTFKATYKDVDRIYLTLPELQAIEQKTFKMDRLEIVKDLFLFQCYTGLAYSDMALLTENDVSLGIDGNKWIIIRRKKTDIRSVIPLLPMAFEYSLDAYTKKNTVQKNSKICISHKVKDYGNDPFIVKKSKQSKEFLEKYGFPKELILKK